MIHAIVAFQAAGRSNRGWVGARAPAFVALAYPVWIFVASPVVSGNITSMVIGLVAAPSVVLAGATYFAFRHAIPTLGALIAGPVGAAAGRVFEQGTHGPWYIQSEAMALGLSVVLAVGTWIVIATGSLVLWRARLARFRAGCAACGYDDRGLAPDAPCPECGSTVRTTTRRTPRA